MSYHGLFWMQFEWDLQAQISLWIRLTFKWIWLFPGVSLSYVGIIYSLEGRTVWSYIREEKSVRVVDDLCSHLYSLLFVWASSASRGKTLQANADRKIVKMNHLGFHTLFVSSNRSFDENTTSKCLNRIS